MSAETVILVHGLWMTGYEMSLLTRRLAAAGYRVVQFRYRMVSRPLDFNLERLAEFIETHTHDRCHIIGHSLGGVLALQVLQEFPDLPVDKVVCLGSPLVDTRAGRRFMRFATGRAMLGRTLPEAIFEKPLGRWAGPQKVGVIAGTLALGLGRFVGSLPRPNDGMVGVSETCLPGIDDHLEIRLGHTGLILSDVVAEQSMHFLRHSQFRH